MDEEPTKPVWIAERETKREKPWKREFKMHCDWSPSRVSTPSPLESLEVGFRFGCDQSTPQSRLTEKRDAFRCFVLFLTPQRVFAAPRLKARPTNAFKNIG
ncbi:hypothetical protein AAG906_012245 [Vitis piasezkii]